MVPLSSNKYGYDIVYLFFLIGVPRTISMNPVQLKSY